MDAWRAGFGEAVIITTPELEALIRTHLAEVLGDDLPVAYVHQRVEDVPPAYRDAASHREKPWGTAHAVLAASSPGLSHGFAVANSDDWYGPAAWETLARALTGGDRGATPTAYAVGYPVAATLSDRGGVSRGWLDVGPDGGAARVVELLDVRRGDPGSGETITGMDPVGNALVLADDAPVSMNLWGFPGQILPLLEESFAGFLRDHGADPTREFALSTGVSEDLEGGRLRLRVLPLESDVEWFGVTHPGDAPGVAARLAALHTEGVYQTPLMDSTRRSDA